MLPESLLTSVTAAAITDTSQHLMLASAGANSRYVITDVDVMNTSGSVDTVVDLIAGAASKWAIPAGRSSGTPKTFDPPLDLGLGEALAIKVRDAASVQVSVRYGKKGR